MAEQRDAQRARDGGACTSLQRAWSNADLVDSIVAYLPLAAIVILPILDRRRRDEHPSLVFRLARSHKSLHASTTAFLDEIRATGRDLRLSRFDGSHLSAWEEGQTALDSINNPDNPDLTEYEMTTDNETSCIQITRTSGRGHSGLELPLNLVEHRVHQIRYRFRFTDSLPGDSFVNVENYAFAYLNLGRGMAGLMVSPEPNGKYELQFHMVNEDEDEDDSAEKTVAQVFEDTWYSVTMVFNWVTMMVRVKLAASGQRVCEKPFEFLPSVMHNVAIYNFSPSVSRYAGLEVLYPPATPPPPSTV